MRHFNGGLFNGHHACFAARHARRSANCSPPPTTTGREVEPAIFGTLLEQALDPTERRQARRALHAARLCRAAGEATVIEPLRADWQKVAGRRPRTPSDAGDAARRHRRRCAPSTTQLCATRVLDPACGTGNFLYVSLELMKRLEGEVLEALAELGGQESTRGLDRETVDPHQFLGLELNPRAAAIAELVLWIGYLQ